MPLRSGKSYMIYSVLEGIVMTFIQWCMDWQYKALFCYAVFVHAVSVVNVFLFENLFLLIIVLCELSVLSRWQCHWNHCYLTTSEKIAYVPPSTRVFVNFDLFLCTSCSTWTTFPKYQLNRMSCLDFQERAWNFHRIWKGYRSVPVNSGNNSVIHKRSTRWRIWHGSLSRVGVQSSLSAIHLYEFLLLLCSAQRAGITCSHADMFHWKRYGLVVSCIPRAGPGTVKNIRRIRFPVGRHTRWP